MMILKNKHSTLTQHDAQNRQDHAFFVIRSRPEIQKADLRSYYK